MRRSGAGGCRPWLSDGPGGAGLPTGGLVVTPGHGAGPTTGHRTGIPAQRNGRATYLALGCLDPAEVCHAPIEPPPLAGNGPDTELGHQPPEGARTHLRRQPQQDGCLPRDHLAGRARTGSQGLGLRQDLTDPLLGNADVLGDLPQEQPVVPELDNLGGTLPETGPRIFPCPSIRQPMPPAPSAPWAGFLVMTTPSVIATPSARRPVLPDALLSGLHGRR